jgi:hypothetical protein
MEFKDICKQTAKDLDEDLNLVHKIAMYQYKYIIAVMQHPTDTHDILINKLVKFKLKSRFKENKLKKYSPKL